MKKLFSFNKVLALALVFAMFIGSASAFNKPWSFGVMADTQWIGADDGKNPNTVAVEIIKQLNQQFITYPGLEFVIQVGDLVDSQSTNSLYTTAIFRQQLYDNGIGFFPVRGNHESNRASAATFRTVFPQTQNGVMNNTPGIAYNVPNPDPSQPNPVKTGNTFTVGTNFSSPPTSLAGDLMGLTYAFDFHNARFVLLDQFTPADSGSSNLNPAPNTIDNQQPWISSVLSGKPANTHAFVFSHKGLITENHVDTLFGSDPSKDPAGQDALIKSLYNNGVRYYMGGHDHMHNRSLVSVTTGTPTDGFSEKVQDIICASDSSKFYTPGNPSNDDKYDVPAFSHKRQAQIAQELHTVGYYIFTVDGPRVTVDYYSAFPSNIAPDNCSGPNCEWLLHATPALNFIKTETFGYSLNGKEFQVCQVGQLNCNSSYTQVVDSNNGTTAKILSGVNGSAARDFDDRNFIKTVDTGWTPANTNHLASSILTLWGMADLGIDRTDVYTLVISYDQNRMDYRQGGHGLFGLATKDDGGRWINAVDMNFGGTKKFALGAWDPSYKLGTYGLDPNTNTAWAVINYNGDFAVAGFEKHQDQDSPRP